ncbi:MAG: flavin reductase family protein [Nitrospiraceae bacterium]|nr:flavin reductase family protein [Nitrospiraceae bacterium]
MEKKLKSLGAKILFYPTPVMVVGTYDKEGRPNVMTAAWGGVCCSAPPSIAVSLRKATYSYGNLVERKAFTISIPSEAHMKEADYFGMVSGKNEDKFKATGLTPVRSQVVDAPYVGEFPFIVECRLIHTVEIGLHTQFIGEVADIKVDPSVLSENGATPDMEKLRPLIFTPESRLYYGVGNLLGKAFSVGKR